MAVLKFLADMTNEIAQYSGLNAVLMGLNLEKEAPVHEAQYWR